MKRWELRLMGVLLLTRVLAYFYRLWDAIKLVLIFWLAGRGVFAKAAGDRPLKVATRIVIGAFAAVGCLLSIDYTLHFLPAMPDMPRLLTEIGAIGAIAFIPCSCLFVYWLDFGYYYQDVSDPEETDTSNAPPPHGCYALTIFTFNDEDCTAAGAGNNIPGQGDHVFAIFHDGGSSYWIAGQDPSMCNNDGDCNLTIVRVTPVPRD